MKDQRPLVIYHANCWDGFCAAWVARQALSGRIGPDSVEHECEFVPLSYGQNYPSVKDRDVFILDFSFPRPVMLEMEAAAKSIVCLDHHKTAEEALRGLSFCTFDMSKSGGRLTWEYFHGNATPPWLVDYTEDRDLWRWQLPYSKEINAALRTLPLDFWKWDALNRVERAAALESLTLEGQAVLRAEEALVQQHVRNAHETTIDGHTVLCVNATCLVSEIAGELAKGRPFGVVWFEGENNERVYSLRSREGGIDVSEIAKAHGGGGHRNAAGFRLPATGALGVFSEGQCAPDDEGDLRIAIAADTKAKLVRIDFGKPVGWLGLPKEQALAWASKIAEKARDL